MIHITRIQAWAFRSPTPKPVATSFGVMHDRPGVLVRVEAADGAFGWGEIFANWPAAGAEHRLRLLQMDIAPLVFDARFGHPSDVFHHLDKQTRIRAVQCGEIGPFAQVIAGLDMAVWDLAARRAGHPLRQFIRADAPNRVAAYASGIPAADASQVIPRARAAGHRRFKVKVGFDLAQDTAAVRSIFERAQPEEKIACDANQAWTLDQAQAFLKAVEGQPLLWLEEPLPMFEDECKWRALAEASLIPLAGGENIHGQAAFAETIQAGHLAVIQPDVAKWGGITGCLAVAQQARSAGLRYCPHFLGAGLGLIASAELLAAVGGDGLLEVDVNENPLRTLFFDQGEPIEAGQWICHSDSGLGVQQLPEPLFAFQTSACDISQ
ncbi:MAG: mandelate racemase/muconate lactonizing enzyme family protein [Alphaproteobacteria bacterium TMED89]|nr:mandelate racemase [Rhodospirillaceae bacterium]RPH19558.1 MAG: mandelate racemase/muconate lactonizing enzyme family protein [Alphaproteobacteria bacterium TMED89]